MHRRLSSLRAEPPRAVWFYDLSSDNVALSNDYPSKIGMEFMSGGHNMQGAEALTPHCLGCLFRRDVVSSTNQRLGETGPASRTPLQ